MPPNFTGRVEEAILTGWLGDDFAHPLRIVRRKRMNVLQEIDAISKLRGYPSVQLWQVWNEARMSSRTVRVVSFACASMAEIMTCGRETRATARDTSYPCSRFGSPRELGALVNDGSRRWLR